MNRTLLGLLAYIAVAVFVDASSVSAQTRSTITGTVKDDTGGILPAATVTLESPVLVGGPQTSSSSTDGTYRFPDLPPGVYTISAALPGFRSVQRPGVRVLFGTTVTVDMTLPLSAVNDVITVTGDTSPVDVRSAAATVKIDDDLLQNLPLMADRRTAFELFSLSPGITGRSGLGGARDANALMLDGTLTTVPDRQGTNAAVLNANWLLALRQWNGAPCSVSLNVADCPVSSLGPPTFVRSSSALRP